MTDNAIPKTIEFLGKEFDTKLLEQAMTKSAETYIEPGKEIHESLLAIDWNGKFKKPVLTIHEGRYVILAGIEQLTEHLDTTGEIIKVKNGFKAKFITKYNFNQSKATEVVAPVVPAVPVQAAPPAYQDRKPAGWKSNNGFHKDPNAYKRSGFGKS